MPRLRARPPAVRPRPRRSADRRAVPQAASARCRPSTAAWRASCTRCGPPKQLDNTYIVFTSDNGFHLGQHRHAGGQADARTRPTSTCRSWCAGPACAPARTSRSSPATPTSHRRSRRWPACARRRSPTVARCSRCCAATRPAHWRTSYLVEHRGETGMTRPARAMPAAGLDPRAARPRPGRARRPPAPPRDPRRHAAQPRRRPIPDYDARADRALPVRGVRHRRARALRPAAPTPTRSTTSPARCPRVERAPGPSGRRAATLRGPRVPRVEDEPVPRLAQLRPERP